MDPRCREVIMSEEYLDLILPAEGRGNPNRICSRQVGNYVIEHEPMDGELIREWYNTVPKIYGLLDTSSMEASGIISLQNQPVLQLRGEGVLIGIIDTGIDYQNLIFREPDGSSKIAAIWDQTIQTGMPPQEFDYGTEFTQEEIDQALRSENPLEIVPSVDENGHGTFLAGIAAGKETEDGEFIGAAPDATLGIVKLKPAKRYLREFFFIPEDAVAFQETDIMAALIYLTQLSNRVRLPLVICLGLGTNQGSHSGVSPASNVINEISAMIGSIVVIAAGNETGRAHHYQGQFQQGTPFQEVEIRVGNEEADRGFCLEFWAMAPEFYSLGIRSPSGEVVPRISDRLGRNQVLDFILEKTKIYIEYRPIVQYTGSFSIFIRFQEPTEGVWTLQIYNSIFINGIYNMWLPMEPFISPDTVFLQPNPDSTLTIPASSGGSMVAAAYNHVNESIYLHSSRGYPLTNIIKPDLAAPGVDIYGPLPGGRFERRSGTSIAAAHLAGATALLMEWAIVKENWLSLNTEDAIAFLIRGAKRKPYLVYPNREWGYGVLDVYNVFEILRNLT